jgi:hypothetical protein
MRRTSALITGVVTLLATGCGETKSYSNDPRPPAPIVLTASIAKDAITVSPTTFGAGPVSLIISNQTSAAQQITFSTAGDAAGFTQQTGPINPGDTATLKAVVPRGKAIVKVQGNGIKPAELQVGAERASAQNDLLQP